MPLIESNYQPGFIGRNGHLATILPSLFRKVDGIQYRRERITTPDDDFIDLDWLDVSNESLMILFHGLEGNSERHYVKGVAKKFGDEGYSVLAVNSRSCSGEINNAPRLYHHADIEDVSLIVSHVIKRGFRNISMVGFSMGGAMIMNYLGSIGTKVPEEIMSVVAFSLPVDLGGSARKLEHQGQAFYKNRFLKKLKKKVLLKSEQFPDLIKVEGLEGIDTFYELDAQYTAPLHGFRDADDFYKQASCIHTLENVEIPALLIIAKNDPFMSKSCYPIEKVDGLSKVYLETPNYGGHVGFPLNGVKNSWMELRAWEFVSSHH